MAASQIEITKRISLYGDMHRLQVWVSRTTNNIPSQLFVYQRYPSVPLSEALTDRFVNIASYADVTDYAIDDPEGDEPFFRKYAIDLVFESLAILLQKWDIMQRQMTHTIEDFVRLNNLPPAEIEIIDIKEPHPDPIGLPQQTG